MEYSGRERGWEEGAAGGRGRGTAAVPRIHLRGWRHAVHRRGLPECRATREEGGKEYHGEGGRPRGLPRIASGSPAPHHVRRQARSGAECRLRIGYVAVSKSREEGNAEALGTACRADCGIGAVRRSRPPTAVAPAPRLPGIVSTRKLVYTPGIFLSSIVSRCPPIPPVPPPDDSPRGQKVPHASPEGRPTARLSPADFRKLTIFGSCHGENSASIYASPQ
mgnify:CR=1 FL=1